MPEDSPAGGTAAGDRTSWSLRAVDSAPGPWSRRPARASARYGGALLVVGLCTALAVPMHRHFDLSNLTMVYLLGVVVAAVAFGRGPAIAASVLAVAAFDFGFVPPRFTFGVADAQYLVTLAVMLIVAVVTSTLTARLRDQLGHTERRERRTAALYALSRELASRSSVPELLRTAAERIAEVLSVRVAVLRPDGAGGLTLAAGEAGLVGNPAAQQAARRAMDDDQITGLPASGTEPRVLHVPLEAGFRVHGVISAAPESGGWDAERLHLLRMLASQTALALERSRLFDEAHAARAQAENERIRSALLSSVSHDLRTPLAAIIGAASSLQDESARMSEDSRQEMAETIGDEAQHLDRLIGNILQMTRLESGTLPLRREWHSLEEVVGAALARLEKLLGERPVKVLLPEDLPLVPLDDVLFGQAVVNLVENAHKYAPTGSPIEIGAALEDGMLRFEVADRGPGFVPGDERRVFEKFYRGRNAAAQPGAGLGLTICQGIVAAHGGEITAGNRPGGGAVFTIRLPLEGEAPAVEQETESPSEART